MRGMKTLLIACPLSLPCGSLNFDAKEGFGKSLVRVHNQTHTLSFLLLSNTYSEGDHLVIWRKSCIIQTKKQTSKSALSGSSSFRRFFFAQCATQRPLYISRCVLWSSSVSSSPVSFLSHKLEIKRTNMYFLEQTYTWDLSSS